MRLTMRSSVVLPEPDDPTSAMVRCELIRSEKSATATEPSGQDLVTCSNPSMATSIWLIGSQQAANPYPIRCAGKRFTSEIRNRVKRINQQSTSAEEKYDCRKHEIAEKNQSRQLSILFPQHLAQVDRAKNRCPPG